MTSTAFLSNRTAIIPVAPVGGLAVAAGLIATASAEDGFVLCVFRRCTGGYCPGCGATRAANRLVRGDVAASWSHNPWVIFGAIQFVLFGALFAINRDWLMARRRWFVPLACANALALTAIWIVRLSNGSIPTGIF